ncbi:WAT1-related protein [Melia azedarach]|uniref:WAT1-related protein n=2 Tax=Melia azedarach TaxID=155640 RepID=A0ACC1XKA0_MELAZ|nr:WAT1-related protein [Melia azedarach]KAJ4711155.1 WAT1-related protein [Melia azedarach]
MGVRSKMEELVPFTLMVIMEGCTIGLTVLAKTAMNGGMSPFVFVVYTNALGSIILLPYSFFYHRERIEQPLFTLPLMLRFFFMGLTGVAISQNLAFFGLYYSSPIVVCVMGLLIPAISFMLSIITRTTKLDWSNPSSQVTIIGTLISIMGAIFVEVYKGPFIRKASAAQLQGQKPPLFIFYSTPDRWVLGGILLAASFLSVSVWNIIQVGTIKLYPQVMKVVSFYSLAGTIQCTIFSLIMERDINAWKLKLNFELLLIIATAIFGSVIRTTVHVSCAQMKGPLYVPMFKPFGIVFATTFGVTFFTNALHYGSVIGAVVTGMGYYTVMWGNIRDDELRKTKTHDINRVESSDEKVPLLQEESEV